MNNDRITRRDFINGMMIATGSTLLTGCSHFRPFAASPKSPDLTSHSGLAIEHDPRVLRGGNLPSTYQIGHWMRDGRLKFHQDRIEISPSISDSTGGSFPIHTDSNRPDVIVIGSGISGLSSAFFLSRQNPKLKILILDANTSFGGNAGRDSQHPIPVVSSTAAAFAVAPYEDYLHEIYRETGVNWESHVVESPFYSYFFDEHTPYILPNRRGWVLDTYGKGLKQMPYPSEILKDFEKARKDLLEWHDREGGPTDPPDQSHPKYDHLAQISFKDYLLKEKKLHPAVVDFYDRYAIDALAGSCEQICAHSAIGFLGSEYHTRFTLPGGNSGVAKHLLKWLIPEAFPPSIEDLYTFNIEENSTLDRESNRVRLRQHAIALRADTKEGAASIIYFHKGKFHQTHANAMIIATQAHSSQHLLRHLADEERLKAWKNVVQVPAAVANVTLKSAAPLLDLGLGYNQFWWGGKQWVCFIVADWATPNRLNRNRETVLTFYDGNTTPADRMPAERTKVLSTPFSEYENNLREDLTRILGQSNFNFDRDVSAIYLYRWGHPLVLSKPGFVFNSGPEGRSSSRYSARKQLGRISFAGQDTEGTPSIESAIGSGLRASQEVLKLL